MSRFTPAQIERHKQLLLPDPNAPQTIQEAFDRIRAQLTTDELNNLRDLGSIATAPNGMALPLQHHFGLRGWMSHNLGLRHKISILRNLLNAYSDEQATKTLQNLFRMHLQGLDWDTVKAQTQIWFDNPPLYSLNQEICLDYGHGNPMTVSIQEIRAIRNPYEIPEDKVYNDKPHYAYGCSIGPFDKGHLIIIWNTEEDLAKHSTHKTERIGTKLI